MGCDIHLTVERHIEDRWVCVQTIHHGLHDYHGEYSIPAAKDRNYERFARLACVRGSGGLAPRGVPANASETTLQLIRDDGDDGHSHSWLGMDEALPIFAETHRWGERGAYRDGSKELLEFFFFGIDVPFHDAEHRIVFWFDN